jgi:hypothetical protein
MCEPMGLGPVFTAALLATSYLNRWFRAIGPKTVRRSLSAGFFSCDAPSSFLAGTHFAGGLLQPRDQPPSVSRRVPG